MCRIPLCISFMSKEDIVLSVLCWIIVLSFVSINRSTDEGESKIVLLTAPGMRKAPPVRESEAPPV